MKRITSHLCNQWTEGTADLVTLVNPATEEPLAELSGGADLGPAVAFARERGGPALREMTFPERGALLKQISGIIHENRDELLQIAMANGGNTRSDAKFDVDGASGTLAYYAGLAKSLGDGRGLLDGENIQLGRAPRVCGRHVLLPRDGVAVHINAFNFPAWGTMEKAACALLAGMPVISKPATATSLLAHRMCELVVEAKALPAGAFQLLLGSVGNLFDHLTGQDVLAFTGSGQTGAKLRGDGRLVGLNVRVNVEADSLNAAVLGPDVEAGSATYYMFLNDVVRDMTQKTGQKCTAIRRVMAPREIADRVQEDLIERLTAVKVGNPASEGVTMGPLSTAQQLEDVRQGAGKLAAESATVWGGDGTVKAIGSPEGKGYFFGPVLLRHDDPARAETTHSLEVFGPVTTLLVYDGGAETAAELVRRGAGGLVSSVYSDDRTFLGAAIRGMGPYLGRVYIGSEKVADKMAGPGTVLPHLIHGGPGRAGAGEELGGERGLAFYLQRTAVQGDRAILDAVLGKL